MEEATSAQRQNELYFLILYSPFRLMSLIYAAKFEFENPAIMKDKQCKQTERFSVTAKGSGYFLSFDDKSKQKYKVKINNTRGYDPSQIKKEELPGNISKFPQVQRNSLLWLITFYFQ